MSHQDNISLRERWDICKPHVVPYVAFRTLNTGRAFLRERSTDGV